MFTCIIYVYKKDKHAYIYIGESGNQLAGGITEHIYIYIWESGNQLAGGITEHIYIYIWGRVVTS